jgi:hypothetical protein
MGTVVVAHSEHVLSLWSVDLPNQPLPGGELILFCQKEQLNDGGFTVRPSLQIPTDNRLRFARVGE